MRTVGCVSYHTRLIDFAKAITVQKQRCRRRLSWNRLVESFPSMFWLIVAPSSSWSAQASENQSRGCGIFCHLRYANGN